MAAAARLFGSWKDRCLLPMFLTTAGTVAGFCCPATRVCRTCPEWFAWLYDLPDILPQARVSRRLEAVFRHNYRRSLEEHTNPQRPGYALGTEAGLLLCTWPKGGKPSLPFVYSNEVWTGIEYQVACSLIYSGKVSEGLEIVRTARQRYDGRARNPWNEYECGNYYARALASYGLLPALTGFHYSAVEKRLRISPRTTRSGRFFFATDGAWGNIRYNLDHRNLTVQVIEGQRPIRGIEVAANESEMALSTTLVKVAFISDSKRFHLAPEPGG